MTYEQLETQIQGLLKAAAPLRELEPESPDAAELPDIVNQINRLRAKQEKLAQAADLAALSEPRAETFDRGWLERKATDLGIAFRANLSDANLAKRIEEAQL